MFIWRLNKNNTINIVENDTKRYNSINEMINYGQNCTKKVLFIIEDDGVNISERYDGWSGPLF